MLPATALASFITGRAPNRRLLSKTNRVAVAPKETITHHFRFWNWAEEKLSMQPKFVAAENVVKQKPSKHS